MLTIKSNVPSINTQRTLTKNSAALNQSFKRLSTGLRLNSAKDDAAGLFITNRLTSQVRGLNQAVRNANDATSLAQTAEAALNEQGNMLQRLRELAVQAASDSYVAQDRQAIQQEADALISEIDRIATQTAFNDRALLDGSLSNIQFQVGAYENQTVSLTIRGARSFSLGSVYSETSTAVDTNDLVLGEVTLNGFAVRTTATTDDPFSSGGQQASAIAKAVAINEGTVDHGVTAEVNASVTTGTASISAQALAAGALSINGVSLGAITVLANDADSALRNAINAVASATGVEASVDSSNNLVLTAADGRNIITTGSATLNVGAATYTGTLTFKSEDQVIVGGTAARIGLTGNITTLNSVNVDTLSFTSQAGATTAIEVLDDAIRAVSDRQSRLGALLNRMDAAVSQLAAASENIDAARSQIRDADFAAETAQFSSNQILQQASTAMLAQANVANQIALTLIG
ncbi:MAG: hypothetical protein KTR25_03605 [Myxococcales bacterium]|nr:hypothetical protein [Myxococcales bacterium]